MLSQNWNWTFSLHFCGYKIRMVRHMRFWTFLFQRETFLCLWPDLWFAVDIMLSFSEPQWISWWRRAVDHWGVNGPIDGMLWDLKCLCWPVDPLCCWEIWVGIVVSILKSWSCISSFTFSEQVHSLHSWLQWCVHGHLYRQQNLQWNLMIWSLDIIMT